MTRLNLGSGGRCDKGWTHVDREYPVKVTITKINDEPVHHEGGYFPGKDFVKLDIANDPWPWDADSVEGIVMHHVVDLLTTDEMRRVLAMCHIVLRPGGVLRVSSADIIRGIEAALERDQGWFVEKFGVVFGASQPVHPSSLDFERTLGHFILQGGARKQFLPQLLFMQECVVAGFKEAQPVPFKYTVAEEHWITELDDRAGESWFVEAVK